jgi:O-antigen ligase
MTDVAPTGRRRRSSQAFSSRAAAVSRLGWPVRLALGVAPLVICLAHLTFGANQVAASLWLTALCALSLAVALSTPLRIGLYDLVPSLPVVILFGLTLAVAAWTLTPWAPGGAHPIWAWAGISRGAITVDRGQTVLEMVKLCGLACLFGLGALQGLSRDRSLATLEAIVWTGGGYALVSLITFVAGVQIAVGDRLAGGFLSANSGATVFGILTVLALALFLRGWQKKAGPGLSGRITALAGPLACLSLFIVCLILTQSRMGLAATLFAAGALLVFTFAQNPKGKVSAIVAGLLMLTLASILLFSGNALVWTRLDALEADAGLRGQILDAHWQAFLASPLFGYGLGSFDTVNLQVMTAENSAALWYIRATHNVYLQWLQEAGLVGAIPMFLLIATILSLSAWRSGGVRGSRTPVHGLLCANFVVLIHGMTDYALQVPSIAAFWAFLLGLQFAYGQGRG